MSYQIFKFFVWNAMIENTANSDTPHSPIGLRDEASPAWKGSLANDKSKRMRCRKYYPSLDGVLCERCLRKPAVDRHHRDDNIENNEPGNILLVCRKCHMELDRRLDRLMANKALWWRIERDRWGDGNCKVYDPRPCKNCGRLFKPLRKGRCATCDRYFREHRTEWARQGPRRLQSCTNCGDRVMRQSPGRCPKCQDYIHRHGIERPPRPGKGKYSFANRLKAAPKICIVCSKVASGLTRNRCIICYNFNLRTGADRTKAHIQAVANGRKFRPKKSARPADAEVAHGNNE